MMRSARFVVLIAFVVLLAVGSGLSQQPATPPAPVWSLLIRNAEIFDGTGRPSFRADVRIVNDRIVAVGRLKLEQGEKVFDAHGLALAPGFIDMHSHASGGIFDDRSAEVMIRQGITTALVGQDGSSPYPLADFFVRLEKQPAALNLASMVGQGTLREQIMGKNLLRPSTEAELSRMRELLAQEMRAGAFGISTGLEYDAGHMSTPHELVELSKVAASFGGFYTSHVRDEGNKVFESFDEIFQIGKQANIPVEISHIKLATTPVWHQAKTKMPALFAEAKRQHVNLIADVYPYTFWHSSIRVIMLDRDYFNPAKVAKAIEGNGGPGNILVVHYEPDPSVNGKTLDQIAAQWQITPVDAYMRIVRETLPGPDGTGKYHDVIVTSVSEDDLRWFIASPYTMFCTDGGLHMQHPRSAGSYPRVLGRYVRELKLLPLQTAIYKMSLMPARQLGLRDRGKIAPGFVADLVLFDPVNVIDRATLQDWSAAPLGIPGVMVSGQWVVEDGKVTGRFPGKVLRHEAASPTGNR